MMLTPAAARVFWLALLENAARLTVDADALFPSPRAQALVVLAQEEVGKAVWVYKAFWDAWNDSEETQHEVHELRKLGLDHVAKHVQANDFLTAMVDVPGFSDSVDIEIAREHAPDALRAYLASLAQEDNDAKKKAFYVDMKPDGSFTVPHEIDRPFLRFDIYRVADMIHWFCAEDQLRASVSSTPRSPTQHIEVMLEPVLAKGSDG
ncbi:MULTISPECIES: AbiV family abortive infection protein [unclassified Cryobacterium]|uniref:AbiV family abortive infection protein n=1 Tax=unclassified Cryobacterium TaxID=2649013 RepID=UPI001F543894|nr:MULTISPECIES: AbiV family abortive infection protein [unclassified Cryobacterium]